MQRMGGEEKSTETLRLPQSAVDRYLDGGDARCPNCGSPDIEAGSHDADGDTVVCNVECSACGNSWQDRHSLSGIENVIIVPDAQIIKLGIHGIIVTLDGKGGATIESDLLAGKDTDHEETDMTVAFNTVEFMILALACEGLDIDNPSFKCALETVLDKLEATYS